MISLGVMMGHTEKAPLFSDICTAWKGEILFQDFFCNVNTNFMVQFGYICKANNKNFKFLSDNQTYYK